jgi:hypothetical protein
MDMNTLRVLAALTLTFGVTGCPPPEPKPIPPPNPPVDTDWCKAMCDHLGPDNLDCEEGTDVYNSDKPGPKDVPNQTCEDWCVEMQDKGLFLNPRCVSTVPSCREIEEYRQKEPKSCAPDKQ